MSNRPLLGNRYQFVKTLGSDPEGGTYLVVDTVSDDHPKCVVKKLPLFGKSSKVTRFILVLLEKKAEALKQVSNHDQVPKILTYFEEDKHFYIVEEFIPGRPISDALRPGQMYPETDVQQFIREILQILLVVHSWGVIHRCIKPSNLIRRHLDNQLVLTGFGIFKEISTQNSRKNSTHYDHHLRPRHQNGASVYVPMEQVAGQCHFSSDIYAVGIIGIQALTGLPPQELQHMQRVGRANEGYIPESLSWHSYVKVSPEFRRILDRMVSPNPNQRYTTVANVLEELDRILADGNESVDPSSSDVSSNTTQIQSDSVTAIAPPPPPSPNRVSNRPNRSWIMGVGILALAVGMIGMILNRVPQRLVAAHALRQGNTLQQEGNFEGAIAHYTDALHAFSTADTYAHRGIAYMLSDEPLLAQEDLTRAIELDDTHVDAFYYRGNVRYSLGDLQGALEDYTQAIQLDPNGAIKARVNRGSVRADLGDPVGAIADYDAAIQQNPNLTAAYVNRCLSRSNMNEHQLAIADCTQAIRLEPDSVDAYQNRALVRRRIGETIGAIQDLNIAINLAPDDPDPYYNRGLARIEIGDTTGAIADYTQAIDLDPTHTFAYYDRAIARMNANDAEGAIEDLEQSAKLCLDAGRMGCYRDAQYQLSQALRLQQPPVDIPEEGIQPGEIEQAGEAEQIGQQTDGIPAGPN